MINTITRAAYSTRLSASGSRRLSASLGPSTLRQYSIQNVLQQAHRALNEQNLPKAKTLFETLASEPNATVDTHYNLGVVEWLSKNPEAAVSRWQKALQ